jgi:hypothetical protein
VPQYIFVYRTTQASPTVPMDEVVAAWSGWFDSHGPTVVDPGVPVFERASVGDVGPSTALGGYSVVNAADLESAIELARTSPALRFGGGVEVGVLAALPPEHGARRLSEERAVQA